MTEPRVAIVQDALCVPGGSERFTLGLARAFPNAPIFTSVYLPEQTHAEFKKFEVRQLPGAKWIKSERDFKLLFPYWLYQFQHLDLSEFDVVISSSTYLAKYIAPKPPTIHLSIIHAPFRLLWSPSSYSDDSLPVPKFLANLTRFVANNMRNWDVERTSKIDKIYANSKNMAAEIKNVYGREADVIYPPLDLDRYSISKSRADYFVTLSRLISHKRVELAIHACKDTGKELWVVGDGPERKKLEKLAGQNVKFLGRLTDNEMIDVLKEATALIFPGQEDFGIAPLEAMACGVPVIAFGKGGVVETVQPGLSGIFFEEQTSSSLAAAIGRFESLTFDSDAIRQSVLQFSIENFTSVIQLAVQNCHDQKRKT